jgi:hypothetical protein
MTKMLKTRQNRTFLPATSFRSRPGDFALGSPKSRAAARALLVSQTTEQLECEADELGNLSAFELAVGEGHSGGVRLWAIRLARMAEEKAKIFGFSLPTPEQFRHAREIARLADELADGRLLELSSSNPAEAKRLRALAEERWCEASNPPTDVPHRNMDSTRKSVQRDETSKAR